MSFKMFVVVVNTINKIKRNFLWGWGKDKKKISWVAWDKVCEDRTEGGLGVKNLRLFNEALLGKWIWRLQSEKSGLWKEIL